MTSRHYFRRTRAGRHRTFSIGEDAALGVGWDPCQMYTYVRSRVFLFIFNFFFYLIFFYSLAGLDDTGSLRYSVHSDEADGYFTIDPVKGTIRTTAALDHESFESVLLNVKAYSASDKYYGAQTQVSG